MLGISMVLGSMLLGKGDTYGEIDLFYSSN